MSEPTFSGVLCPLVTPFEDGTVDETSLTALVHWLVDRDIDGVVPCGTTGEFASLSRAEFRTVVETTVDAADGRVPVVAGVAGTDSSTVTDRIEFAASVGADAVLLTQPYFHTAPTPAGDLRFFEMIAESSPLPLVLYNIPACTGQPIAPETVAELSENDAVVGLKDSSGDFDYFLELLRVTDDQFTLLEGYDQHYVSGVHAGSDGGINALSNVVPEVFAEIRDEAFAGETESALELEQDAFPGLFGYCMEYGFATVAKVGLEHRGVIESAEVRPPLTPVPDDVAEEISTLVAGLAD
ncbi:MULTISPECIES: dihydrodipicolinate synthase family protein [Haloferax]|uniref:Dihydrodipicolinate synthase family protein n=1 Tax=Haloferax marinum TaxID=2666143 RepID=A0A6A8G3F6_9EURY|nr:MULTISPECIES: dihydrodipicolinate synthase family protein [Haloferax]KAB1196117.1 dihydrodipicolinate synthase family protein [Haloferax sp. CBA1150]MRW95102.1 dihydrodipicolinate synthase family protein [Haloferax marinum]